MTADSEVFVFNGIKLKISHPQELVWRLQSQQNGVFDDGGAAQTLAADLKEPLPETPHTTLMAPLGNFTDKFFICPHINHIKM